VLPLENLSTDPEQEYFSDGLTDELITRLASLNGLTVISRTSSMQYKDSRKPLPQIAKELGVDAIVAGSVLRSGDRIRITAQLIRASTDRHLWAHSYERAQEDVLELQNDVTRDIADNIELTIDPALRERLEKKGSIDPAAHEAYLRGRYQLSKRRIPDMKQAGAYFEEAIDRDPDYALAYAALANSYALLGAYDPPQEQYIPKARAAALKALSLDGGLSEAHLSLAVIAQNYDMDWTTAEREYLKAIDLDPNNATAHHWYAEFLAFHARFPEAFAQIERAKQLDPFSLILLADRAVILYYARRYDESIAQFEEVIAADPRFPRATLVIGPYIEKHRFRKALAQLDRFDPNGTNASATGARIYVYGRAGDVATARRLLRKLESRIDPDHMDVTAFVHAHVGVGNNNKAFSDLYQALEQHSTALSSLKVNPLYDPLRSDPRFADLLHKVKLD
jgi:TolB-like protein/Tfp pilus assembly protein PilF